MKALDSRVWIVWAVSLMVPALMTRHPVIIGVLLVIAITVRLAAPLDSALNWQWLVRIAVIFGIIGVVFNALTVRSGRQVAWTLPGIGWPITWNAIVYGVVSALAMVTLVLVGTTAAAGISWMDLVRSLPYSLVPLAVAGSVAWSFLPSASDSFGEIREAQAARGHRLRGARDVLPILAPLLEGALDRALLTAEVLEVRGFGGSAAVTSSRYRSIASLALIAGLVVFAFSVASGATLMAVGAGALAAVSVWLLVRTSPQGTHPTRFRPITLNRPDLIVAFACVCSLVVFVALASIFPQSIVFNPYPNLRLVPPHPLLVLALLPTLAPALIATLRVNV